MGEAQKLKLEQSEQWKTRNMDCAQLTVYSVFVLSSKNVSISMNIEAL
jgi:hypothetical protein